MAIHGYWSGTPRDPGLADRGGSGVGEVDATASRGSADDYDGRYDAWPDTADRPEKRRTAAIRGGAR